MASGWMEQVRALGGDHWSPSSALAARASDLLQQVARDEPAALPEVARGVVLAQPGLAALANVANVAVRALESLGAGSVAAALAELQRIVSVDRRAAARSLCERLDAPVRVVTTSASAAVVEALQALRREDLLRGVVCGESRPLLEGSALARWLADQGFDVLLVTDAALAEHLVPGAVFVAGVDAILPHALASRAGTRLYATWARLAGVERYALGSRESLYPPALEACFADPGGAATARLPNPPATLQVEDRAFDLSPRDLWTEIFVGAQPVHVAEQSGDRDLGQGLRPLLEPHCRDGPGGLE